jgi:hypothetical protein
VVWSRSSRSTSGPTCSSYGVLSETEKVVELFLEREAAEAMIGEAREDEPALAEDLRIEAVELGSGPPGA